MKTKRITHGVNGRRLTSRNILSTMLDSIREGSGHVWPWTVIVPVAQTKGFIKPGKKHTHEEYFSGLRCFASYALERYLRGIFLGRWKSGACKLWQTGQLVADGVAQIVLDEAESIVKEQGLQVLPPCVSAIRSPKDYTPRVFDEFIPWEDETAEAIAEMARWMCVRAGRKLWKDGDDPVFVATINAMIRAMCLAVVNFTPRHAAGFRIPVAFDARSETHEEREIREMLDGLSKGAPA